MMKKLILSLALVPLAIQIHADAPVLDKSVAIGIGIGAQRYNGSFGDQGSGHIRGILAYHPLEWLGTRVTAGYGGLTNDAQMAQSFKTEWFSDLGVDLVLQPQMGMGAFRPFLASGISSTFGTAKVDGEPIQDLDWNYYVPVEVGVEYLIADNLSVWVSGETYAYMRRWDRLDGVNSGGNYFERRDDWQKVGIGFSFRIGARTDADGDGIADDVDQCSGTPDGVMIDPRGCPLDGDKDGVPDYKDLCRTTPPGFTVDGSGCTFDTDKDGVFDGSDKCLNTPLGDKVDYEGCSIGLDADKDGVQDSKDKCPGSTSGSMVDATGCPLDSDKDGIADDVDNCPGTPARVKVGATGCILPAADADHDGIADSLDKCPGTRSGTKVDTNGCAVIVIVSGAKLIIEGIVFKTGSAVIDQVSAPVLGRAAVAISKAPRAMIEIAGFTDNVGSDAYNQRLSERRASAVKAYLVKSGVPSSQLTARGYGEEEPVVDNSSVESRSENRRIEFRVK